VATKAAKLKRKRKHMSEATFQELTAAFQEAITHARGQNTNLRVTRVKVPSKSNSGKALTKNITRHPTPKQ